MRVKNIGNTQKVIEKDVTFFFCKDSPPPWFDGSISGDFGFDPLGLGKRAFFAQAELTHSRWAMLAVSGILILEWLESLGFIEKFSWYDAGAQEYFADSTTLFVVQLGLMGWVEGRRWADIIKPGCVDIEPSFPHKNLSAHIVDPGHYNVFSVLQLSCFDHILNFPD
ncbi:photosystem I chlorophyll a/b-binding protein 6, chloroplastic-like [Impatiens glandulifera]|uniref:photosystem I chlorophyll a/b-binding protein 6, chloroplastic-like n=1 Tax=Impatiens glandulifera TaxID=253017 RepID=UPI001FB07142|nr:photosystem I chlorophyll a/b-binding protein 6, chloroplastic-like [Impatiens glandulifera]